MQEQQQRFVQPPIKIDPSNQIAMFGFKPPGAQSYVFEFTKKSRKGCIVNKQFFSLSSNTGDKNEGSKPTGDMNMSMAFGDDDNDTAAGSSQQQNQN